MAAMIIINRETYLDVPDIIFGNHIVYIEQVPVNLVPGSPVIENIGRLEKRTMVSV